MATKLPARGDKVIDNTRVMMKEGYIKSGVFDSSGPSAFGEEVIKDAWVEFGAGVGALGTAWYTVEQLQDCWDEEQQAFIINE